MPQEIDPRFFIPPFVTGVEYKNTEQPSSDAPIESTGQDETDVSVVVDYEGDGDTLDTGTQPSGPDENRLLPPDSITIVSQTSRVTPGGVAVDVVIDIEDIARVSQFEVRITK